MIAPAVGVSDFEVEIDGQTMPILEAQLEAADMDEDADDPEHERVPGSRALDRHPPRDQALWEKGMFANQNVVVKLRQPFTLQRLAEVFNLDDVRP